MSSKLRFWQLPVFVLVLSALVAAPAFAAPQIEGPESWGFLARMWQALFGLEDSATACEPVVDTLRVQVGADEDESGPTVDPVGETLLHEPRVVDRELTSRASTLRATDSVGSSPGVQP